VSWSQTFYTLLTIPEIIFWTIFGYVSTLMISLLNNEESIALITCSCNQIVFFLTRYTWSQIFSGEWFIRGTLLHWKTL